MSQWTHVAGLIRIDGLPFMMGLNQEQERAEVQRMIGNACGYDDDKSKWDACNVPCGSEGSLHYCYDFTGYDEDISHSAMRSAISIWGDLRDYGDKEAIVKWFKSVVAKFRAGDAENKGMFSIRDAVLSIEAEGSTSKTICVWNGKEIVRRSVKVSDD